MGAAGAGEGAASFVLGVTVCVCVCGCVSGGVLSTIFRPPSSPTPHPLLGWGCCSVILCVENWVDRAKGSLRVRCCACKCALALGLVPSRIRSGCAVFAVSQPVQVFKFSRFVEGIEEFEFLNYIEF